MSGGENCIEVSHLTKDFVIQKQVFHGLKGIIMHLPSYINSKVNAKTFRALNDINFSMKPGETLGLIGPNGCGKTTLLSVIGKVLRCYQGTVVIRGRIGMMLALGAGFANELTGRENVLMSCVLQGLTRKQADFILEEIVDFADLDEFIDQPLYQYSTGMQMRLGFAVATIIEPDILLIDEAMAVGDASFAKKCEIKIQQLLSHNISLILVSHNPADIRKYCRRVLALQNGTVVFDGATEEYYKNHQG